jgi:hypothetical protein
MSPPFTGDGFFGDPTMQHHSDPSALFDLYCFYRDLYARRGLGDRSSTLSVERAVVYAEGLLRVARRREEMAARRTGGATAPRAG